MPAQQPTESHADGMISIENEMELWGIRTREKFLLNYDRLMLVLTFSLLPEDSKKLIVNKFTTIMAS